MLSILMITILCGITWMVRVERNKALALKYSYKFYALRDHLRESLIDEKIEGNNWAFDFLDSSFSRLVNQLETINIYKAVFWLLLYKNDDGVLACRENFNKSLDKNKELKKVYDVYSNFLLQFFKERHRVLTRILQMERKYLKKYVAKSPIFTYIIVNKWLIKGEPNG